MRLRLPMAISGTDTGTGDKSRGYPDRERSVHKTKTENPGDQATHHPVGPDYALFSILQRSPGFFRNAPSDGPERELWTIDTMLLSVVGMSAAVIDNFRI
jgi:hypothetical protein